MALGGVLLALGVLVGLVWWALAPVGAVVQAQGYVVPVADGGTPAPADAWAASQDALFAVLVTVAGVLGGVLATVRAGSRLVPRVVTAAVTGLPAAAVAWGVGVVLGPPSLAAQEAGAATPLVSPLALSSPAALLLWPTATCVVVFAVATASLLIRPPADD